MFPPDTHKVSGESKLTNTMIKVKQDLRNMCVSKGFTTFDTMQYYARRFSKYDNLTYRDLDEVHDHIQWDMA